MLRKMYRMYLKVSRRSIWVPWLSFDIQLAWIRAMKTALNSSFCAVTADSKWRWQHCSVRGVPGSLGKTTDSAKTGSNRSLAPILLVLTDGKWRHLALQTLSLNIVCQTGPWCTFQCHREIIHQHEYVFECRWVLSLLRQLISSPVPHESWQETKHYSTMRLSSTMATHTILIRWNSLVYRYTATEGKDGTIEQAKKYDSTCWTDLPDVNLSTT